MRTPVRILLAAVVATAGLALPGCGGSDDGLSCDDEVCTVRSEGPGTFTLDQQSTEVELSDLRDDTVRVRINSEARTVVEGADPVRVRGFLVTAVETSPDRAEVRIER